MVFSGHRTRKRFGQHWLTDQLILDEILEAADLQSEDRVLEVGPGRGALTQKLLASKAAVVHTIELDRELVVGLKKRFSDQTRFSVREGDVLSVSLLPPDGLPLNKVVANIPYNITGPLLERLLGRLGQPVRSTYERLVILLQKEVADRILARPGNSSFSALSVRIQLLAECKRICVVPPSCFQPPPKVQSQVILIEPLNPQAQLEPLVAKRVEILLKTAFISRRKMLRNTLGKLFSIDKLEILADGAGITLDDRPQEVSPSGWVELARGLHQSEFFR